MRKLLFTFFLFCALTANAQDYYITFKGTGASTTVSTVKVENLTTGVTLILNGGDVLHLKTIITGVISSEFIETPALKIYPNPMNNYAILQVSPPAGGDATITVFDMSGKLILLKKNYLENCLNEFRISGLNNGAYLISVMGRNYKLSGKLVCNGKPDGAISLEKINIIQETEAKTTKNDSKGVQAEVEMAYTSGDMLKFTSTSGDFVTILTDIPTGDKTISFDFVPCSVDEYNYPVVNIGTQIWMAENLKATKYNDNSPIPLVADGTEWAALSTPAYCWYDNNEALNKNTYGGLYNWYTTDKANNGGKNICPAGWHVPNDAEWSVLASYLTVNGYGYEGSGDDIAKSLSANTAWLPYTDPGTPGNDLTTNNSSGFSGMPGGRRHSTGEFALLGSYAPWWSSDAVGLNGGLWRLVEYSTQLYKTQNGVKDGFGIRCLRNDLPLLTTTAASSILQTSAISGGNITSDGGSAVTERGVCWSTSVNPTIANYHVADATGSIIYSCNLTGLTPNTKYYLRAYATNSTGTAYGNEIFFFSKGTTGTVSDIDGNTYSTIMIGTQNWMAENLETTKYNDGTSIPLVTEASVWAALSAPGYCWYNNNAGSYKDTYGALYNFFAVDVSGNGGKNVCPAGWHLPTDAEWSVLTTYLGGESVAGGKLKETGTAHWVNSNSGVTNETGFNALPGGNRNADGPFYRMGDYGHWWSATPSTTGNAWYRMMNGITNPVARYSFYKRNGFSVRCLQGEPVPVLPTLTTAAISSVTSVTAVSGGNIVSNGGASVITSGVCWSLTTNPTISNSKTTDGTSSGSFTSTLTGLTANSTYYVRAYATNTVGTSYGNELILKTYTGTVTDIEGNIYNTVTIGTQLWMAENLMTTKYNDGNTIPLVSSDTEWESLTTPGYCWLNNDEAAFKTVYGALYNWYTVNTGKLCPSGWHIPTDTDWSALTAFLGGESLSGAKMKETGIAHWKSPNSGSTNTSGFTALPGGYRIVGGDPWDNNYGAWWTYTENYLGNAWMRLASVNINALVREYINKNSGFSVRCIKSESGLPSVETNISLFYSNSSVIYGGNATSDGSDQVTENGIYYGTSENPEVTGTKLQISSGSGSFFKIMSGLTPNTVYYIKAYAINTTGVAYGAQKTFTIDLTPDPQLTITTTDASSWNAGNWTLSTVPDAAIKLFASQASFENNLPDFTANSDINGIVKFYGLPINNEFSLIVEKDNLKNIKDGYLIIGVFNDQADINASPVQTGSVIGGLKYLDYNADFQINGLDKVWKDRILTFEGQNNDKTVVIGN